jgi:hypothetical protein
MRSKDPISLAAIVRRHAGEADQLGEKPALIDGGRTSLTPFSIFQFSHICFC